MEIVRNPRWREAAIAPESPTVGIDAPKAVGRFLAECPAHKPTPLHRLASLAVELGVKEIFVKDESQRLGLQSFKALGGVYAILEIVAHKVSQQFSRSLSPSELFGSDVRAITRTMTFVCASDGNHGRSVASGARLVGANCVVYLHGGVSAARAEQIARLGARIVRTEGNYDRSVEAAQAAARSNGWMLVADTGETLADETPNLIMRGYTVIADEILNQMDDIEPRGTHLFVQAGVGGLAAAMAGHMAARLGARAPHSIVVEPELACCLLESCRRGEATEISQCESTVYAMLECNRPSPHAWEILYSNAAFFMSVPDAMAATAMRRFAFPTGDDPKIVAGESGVAGFAGLLCACAGETGREALGLTSESVVLLINTEGATDAERYRDLVGIAPVTNN